MNRGPRIAWRFGYVGPPTTRIGRKSESFTISADNKRSGAFSFIVWTSNRPGRPIQTEEYFCKGKTVVPRVQPSVDELNDSEISRLTEEAVAKLLKGRATGRPERPTEENRQHPRWPFLGQVQLWFTDGNGRESIDFASCVDLSLRGLGMLFADSLSVKTELTLTVHQPEASLHGRGIVRHCSEIEEGYYIGIEFVFDV